MPISCKTFAILGMLFFVVAGMPSLNIISTSASISGFFAHPQTLTQFTFPPMNPMHKHHYKHGDPPMGVTDIGVNAGIPYTYNAESVVAATTFHRLFLLGCAQSPNCDMSDQLNAVTIDTLECNVKCWFGNYWTQDVLEIHQTDQTHFNVQAIDNIWNFSAVNANMTAPVTGSGGYFVCTTCTPQLHYYGDNGPSATVTAPFYVELVLRTFVNAGRNAEVDFKVSVWEVTNTGTLGTSVLSSVYDTVVFNSFGISGCPSCSIYHVGGSAMNGLANDIENVLGGAGGGASVTVPIIDVSMATLQACQTCIAFSSVPHAFSFGEDTAETVNNVAMSMIFGCCNAFGETGADNTIQLY